MNQRQQLAQWMEQALPDRLRGFLPQRRWFGGKARAIVRVELEDAAWLPGDHRPYALVVVRVQDAIGERTAYSLLLAFNDHSDGRTTIGRVEDGGDVAWVIEATDAPDAALALLRGFASPETATLPMLHGGTVLYRDADEIAARVLDGSPIVRPIGAEQSNTSLRIDRTLAFKLFRRLEPGENPELEIGRFLTLRTSFRALPMLRGSLTYVSARGEPATLGVLQDWIESEGDGWSHVVALLQQSGDGTETLRQDAFSLGTTTASFHQALAAHSDEPAFSPEPVTRTDVETWRRGVVERLSRTTDLVSRHMSLWPEPAVRLAESFVSNKSPARVIGRLPDPDTSGGRFHKIRVHGDYHLGQTLKTAQGFVLIDFEGEPARPLAERRAKHAALKDVAGMIRSFEYAVDAALAGNQVRAEGPPAADLLRRAFLEGYCSGSGGSASGFVPADRQSVDAWIDLFELEKALYEIEYEVNNRPAWVHIPLRGLVRILSGRSQKEAP